MRKFTTLLIAGFGVVGVWWWQRGHEVEASSIASPSQIIGSFVRPDPTRLTVDRMPDGARFVSAIEQVQTYQDLSTVLKELQIEVDRLNAVVAAIQALHNKTLDSCDSNVDSTLVALETATEKGQHFKSVLAEVDEWLRRVIAFIQDKRPADGKSAAGLYQNFQRQRTEIEQSIDTINSTSKAIPRLRKLSCEPLEIPPFRASTR